ncbi:MAG: alpha/beta fold hydrolase [Flavobacteriales bacterium]|nr:alpha/beta fold hydrolase [Flavobacteriales bacterium]
MKILLSAFLAFSLFSAYALKPEREYVVTPKKIGMPHVEYNIPSSGASLNAWQLDLNENRDQDKTIIIAGGDAGNMSYFLNLAAMLSQKGYRVVLFDYRGFGTSSDFEINENQLYYDEYATDLKSVVHFTQKKYPKTKLGVYAFSMGTILVDSVKEELDFLICESSVIDARKMEARIFEQKGKKILIPESAEKRYSTFLEMEQPMLLISGILDTHTPLMDSVEYAERKENVQVLVYNGGHGAALGTMKETLINMIDGYIAALD